jgi:penicillin amidase
MRTLLGWVLNVVAVLGIGTAILWGLLPYLNDRQTSGTVTLTGLDREVRVVRDARATPYIYAQSLEDALRGQGFVAGQDRLFQLETAKRAATGRLAEVFGAGPDDLIVELDREARVIGFHRLGARQAEILAPQSRLILQAYLEGLNAYIVTRSETHRIEFAPAPTRTNRHAAWTMQHYQVSEQVRLRFKATLEIGCTSSPHGEWFQARS